MSFKGRDNKSILERAYGEFTTDADLLSHVAILGLSSTSLNSKYVLEIGSGVSNRFMIGVQEKFPSAYVTAVNPQLASDKICKQRGIDVRAHIGAVAALAQGYLPFKDRAFDTIISVMAVPKYLVAPEVPYAFNEIWRLLKPGGTARLWPLCTERHPDDQTTTVWTDKNYVIYEELSAEVLSGIPEVFRDFKLRMVINRPAGTTKSQPEFIAGI